jgi:hypothetical protein
MHHHVNLGLVKYIQHSSLILDRRRKKKKIATIMGMFVFRDTIHTSLMMVAPSVRIGGPSPQNSNCNKKKAVFELPNRIPPFHWPQHDVTPPMPNQQETKISQ